MKTPTKFYSETHLENKPVRISKARHDNDYFLHWHDFFEIEIITHGDGVQILNGQSYEIKKGQVTLLSPMDFHEFITPNGYEQYNICIREDVFSKETIEKILSIDTDTICYFDDCDFKKIVSLATLLDMETDFSDITYIQNLVECMIKLILKNIKTTKKHTSKSSKALIQKASLYMKMHFKDNISVKDVSSYVNLNPSYFSRLFLSEMGVTPKNYLCDIRLDFAKKLTISTSSPITEIAFASGYSSFSNFLKAFKQKFGVTPKMMRK